MLKLDDKDLSAIASSRANRSKPITIISNVGTGIGVIWLVVLVGIVVYSNKVWGFTFSESMRSDMFKSGMAILFCFMLIVLIVCAVLWKIKSRRILKELKAEYKSKK